MATQRYPTFRTQNPAGRIPPPASLPRFRTTPEDAVDLAIERARQLQGDDQGVAFGDGESLPRWNVDRTPEGDERLTGEGGAELAARQKYPTWNGATGTANAGGVDPAIDPVASPASSLAAPPSVYDQDSAHLRGLYVNPVEDTNGRGRTAARMAALRGSEGAKSGSAGFALGSAIGGAVTGLINKKADEEAIDRPAAIARTQGALAVDAASEKAQREHDAAAADINLKQSQADWNNARPDIEAGKRTDAAAKATQASIFRVLGTLKGQRLDPTDPRIVKLQAAADAAGIPFDVQSFNESKGNLIRYVKTDLAHPEKTITVERNVVTGEETELNQKGFQATRNNEGMTGAEVHADADRDAARTNLERQRSVSNELARAGLGMAQGHLALAGQGLDLRKLELDQRLSEQTRSELKDANKVLADANGAQAEADDYADKGWYVGDDGQKHRAKWAVKAETDAANKAEALRQQFYGDYGYLWGGKMTRLQFSKNHPELMDSSEGSKFHSNREVDDMARRYGIEIVPDDSPVDTAPSVGNSLPRRGAPAAGRAAAPAASGRYAGQRMPAANLPAAAKALGMGEAQAKAYIESQGGVIY
jgi:hypothetical protein